MINGREDSSPGIITRSLTDWRNGDEEALDRLTTAVYRELRRLAGAAMMGQRGRTIQPTALVHELYFQLPGVQHFDWQNRAHFLNVAAKMMRNILASHARKRQAAKRGSGLIVSTVTDPQSQEAALSLNVLLVHQALDRFSDEYPRQARVVELRFFGGLSAEETHHVLTATGVESSLRTVERDWAFARAWLEDAIGSG